MVYARVSNNTITSLLNVPRNTARMIVVGIHFIHLATMVTNYAAIKALNESMYSNPPDLSFVKGGAGYARLQYYRALQKIT